MMKTADETLNEIFAKRNWQKEIGVSPQHAYVLEKQFRKDTLKYNAKIELLKRLGYEVEVYVKQKGEDR